MSDFLHLPVPASLREMGVLDAAVFLIGFSDDQQVIEVQVAVNTSEPLPKKMLDDVYVLALQVYRQPVAKLLTRVLRLTRLEGAAIKIDAAAYCTKEGA